MLQQVFTIFIRLIYRKVFSEVRALFLAHSHKFKKLEDPLN